MKIFFVTILVVYFSIENCKAQSDELFLLGDFLVYWKVDGHTLYELDKRKKRLFWNGRAIDSTGRSLYAFKALKKDKTIIENDKIVGCFEDKGKVYSLALNKNGTIAIKDLPWASSEIMASNTDFFILKGNIDFRKLDFNSLSLSKVFELSKIAPSDSGRYFGLHDLFEVSRNKLLVTTKYCYDGCYNLKFFLVDLNTMSIELPAINQEPDNEMVFIDFYGNDAKYILAESHHYTNQENNGLTIYDYKFNVITKALSHDVERIGYNFRSNGVLSNYISVKLDDGRKAIVLYRFFMPLERSLLRIYSNEILLNEDLIQLKEEELSILKNMLYAKHNFKFNDLFFQAYFNLFEFYDDEKRKSNRLEGVDNLFTQADKRNLQIISVLSKQKK